MLGKAPHPYPEQGRRRSFLAHLLPWDAAQIPSCRSLNCKCCRPRPPAEEPETERSVSLRKSQRKGGAAVRTQSPGSSLCAAAPGGRRRPNANVTLSPTSHQLEKPQRRPGPGPATRLPFPRAPRGTASFLTRRGPPPVTPNLCVLGKISFRL